MNDLEIEAVSSCDAACRNETACELLYAVNEFTLLCDGYDFQYGDSFWYFAGAFENPWAASKDNTVPVETEPVI